MTLEEILADDLQIDAARADGRTGSVTTSIRGRCVGRAPRLVARRRLGAVVWLLSLSALITDIPVSISSSASSAWSWSSFSDFRPNRACLKVRSRMRTHKREAIAGLKR